MQGQRIGSLIAAVFGLIYVLVNSAPLSAAVGVPLRVAGGAAFVAVLIAVLRGLARPGEDPDGAATGRVFGRAYWMVVAAEAGALFGGLAVLNGVLGLPQAGVAWVSVVVGLHFFPLAAVFRQPYFHLLGAIITGCGAVGLVLVAVGADETPIAVVSGVLPGVVLLMFAWWGARRPAPVIPPAWRREPPGPSGSP